MLFAYVGNTTNGEFEPGGSIPGEGGVYAYAVDEETGALDFIEMVAQPNPSYLAISQRRGVLYAASHTTKTFAGEFGSSIAAYRLEPGKGTLATLDACDLEIVDPAHVITDRSEEYLLLACTKGGGAVLCPLAEDGRFRGKAQVMLNGRPRVPYPADASKNMRDAPFAERRRLGVSSPHGIGVDVANRTVLVADRDRDHVAILHIDRDAGRLVPSDPASASGVTDAGPRHLVFHPGNRTVYVNNELKSTVSTYRFDEASSGLEMIDETPTIAAAYKGKNLPSGIAVAPTGRFVYVSNRGSNTVARLAVDPESERLTFLDTVPVEGENPRSIRLTPDGSLMYAANVESNAVVSFFVDPDDGHLTPTGNSVALREPNCVVFWRSE